MDEETTPTENINYAPQNIRTRFRVPVPQQLFVLALMLGLIFVGATGTIITKIMSSPVLGGSTDELANVRAKDNVATTEATTPFSNVSITGKSAFVWDIKGQRALYKKNENDILPLASVTKLMTALVAHELLTPTDTVTISAASLRQDGDSGLMENETFTRRALTNFVLMSSSNDGAYALAAAAGSALVPQNGATAFVNAMNIRAKEIGLTNTTFKNPTGLDLSTTESGANGTAKDMAFLMEYIVKNQPSLLSFTTEDVARLYSQDGIYHDAENTNNYIDDLPGIIGSKTGYTELAGGNLVVAFDAGLDRPIVVVVLGSSRSARFSDVITLAEEAQAYVANQTE